jgi:phosphoesterase RecJ-like protein
MSFENLLNLIKKRDNFVLITHLNPDLDGVSSLLAFYFYLKSCGKKVFPLIEQVPRTAEFLPGKDFLVLAEEALLFSSEWTVILFDANSPTRVAEEVKTKIQECKKFVIIDHHQPEENRIRFPEEEVIIIEPSAPSTSFIVFKFFKFAEVPITPEIAENLLAGIYFDTGGFKYENTKEETFLVAGELCKFGANPSRIAREIFENIPFEEIEALKRVLNRLEFLNEGTIAISYLTCEDFEKLGLKGVEYLANFLRSIKGVKVSALVKEGEKNMISVSLRSRAPVEVVDFARSFGGGGHKYASGFKMKINDLREFLEVFKEHLRSYYAGLK